MNNFVFGSTDRDDDGKLACTLLGDGIPIDCVPRVSSAWIHPLSTSSDEDDCANFATEEKFDPYKTIIIAQSDER